ncbi:hypothetical protein F442_16978 [Phytophthora nicotianae P10297]|uniref:Uncharacterized protein n=3 Tax=Phytophthora nicotianae TaxID=4792 RepID=W2PQZ5_PHYN3|nr:hypothetical protein PPTG_16619 [Phytophthora nicotianae INRA-310]ETN02415.1 hypothetical protein PPTG_16619 [Phytophthora nicotianae INRA-310]ETP34754.1 hypothetical protein F442_16978 [Phytophthora nicotianae P10297]
MNETLSEALLLGCYTYAGLPFNVVRLRLQTQSHQGAYRGVRDAFVRIAKEEGIRALSKGGTPSLAGTILSNKLTNVVGGSTKKAVSMLELQKVDDEDELTLQKALEHSAMAFIASTATTVPENIASKLQLQRGPLGHGVYHGPLDCMAQVLKREGIVGLFRGYSSVLLRDVPLFPITVGVYHATRYTGDENSLTTTLFSTSFAMATSVTMLYPADVVRAHMQTTCTLTPLTLRESFRSIYMQYGLRGFYRGFTAALIGSSVSFTAFATAYFTFPHAN